MRVDGFNKRYRGKVATLGPSADSGPAAKLTKKVVGRLVVVRYADDGYQINPQGSGTKELDPNIEQTIIEGLAFPLNGRFPRVPDELIRSGIPISFEGF